MDVYELFLPDALHPAPFYSGIASETRLAVRRQGEEFSIGGPKGFSCTLPKGVLRKKNCQADLQKPCSTHLKHHNPH